MGQFLHRMGRPRREVSPAETSHECALTEHRENVVLALKIIVAEKHAELREIEALQTNSSPTVQGLPGSRYLLTLHDHLELRGPNGTHNCLITELTGPSVQGLISEASEHRRLPGNAAKRFAKQVLLGLDCLHKQGTAHGGERQNLSTMNTSLTNSRSSHGQYRPGSSKPDQESRFV